MRAIVFCAMLAFTTGFIAPAGAETAVKPKELSEAAVVNEVQAIKQADLLKLSKPFEVSGTTWVVYCH